MTPPAAAAAAAAPAVQPRRAPAPGRRLTPPARPRRVSGPARPARGLRARPSPRRSDQERGLALALPSALARLTHHGLIDRLIAGKAWIIVVTFALIGIVTLQLALLGLNTSIGRSLEREGSLQRENAALSIENSEIAAGNRVEARAAQLGMEPVPAGALRFLTARPRTDPFRALSALSATVQQSPSTGASEATSTAAGTGTAAASTSGGEPPAATTPSSSQTSESSGAPVGEAATHAGESSAARESSAAPPPSPSSSAPATPAAPSGGAPTEASPSGGTQSSPAG
jgi:hypothetical protein